MNKLKGITLVELLIALSITAIIGLGAVKFQKSGTGIATSGIANIAMMKQGNLALEVIHDDLKHSCIPYKESFSISFGEIVQVDFSDKRGLEGAEFSFFRMADNGDFVITKDKEKDYRLHPLVHIKYSLKKANDSSDLLQLVRREERAGDLVSEKTIAEKVSFFNISPISVKTNTTEKWLWNVNLKLSQTSDKTQSNSRGEHTLEFYDVVFSEFYRSIAENPHSVRNWNTGFTYSK